MLKKTIKYEDYNGVKREENFYFNLSKVELTEMEFGTEGGYADMVEKIVKAMDQPAILRVFKDLILKSYGEKSADGKRFVKSPEISLAFSQTEAYNELFMELMSDTDAAIKFFNGILPNVPDVDEEKIAVVSSEE